eukprot:6203384-Pleurochrysis_carterae.AAC.3
MLSDPRAFRQRQLRREQGRKCRREQLSQRVAAARQNAGNRQRAAAFSKVSAQEVRQKAAEEAIVQKRNGQERRRRKQA